MSDDTITMAENNGSLEEKETEENEDMEEPKTNLIIIKPIMPLDKLIFNSPVGAEPIIKTWPLTESEVNTLMDCIYWTITIHPGINFDFHHEVDNTCYHSMRRFCLEFNKSVQQYIQGGNIRRNVITPNELLELIMQMVYMESVKKPEKLNNYKPGSSATYGETKYPTMKMLIDKLKIKENDVFLDLGSGIGQLVLQVAGASECKMAYGIENASEPAKNAKLMDRNFKKWMNWFGLRHKKYELIEGNFLEQNFLDIINQATIIFINNVKFELEHNLQLENILKTLEDKTTIITTKNYYISHRKKFRIHLKNFNDLKAILCQNGNVLGAVSWTINEIPFYVHFIDRTHLQIFLKELKRKQELLSRRKSKRLQAKKRNSKRKSKK